MTDSKHTPGPWAVVDDYGMAFEIESRTSGVARVSTADVRAEANARLIAAAPDMLAALLETQSLIAAWRDGGDVDAALEELKYRAIDTAIAKATGQAD